MSGENLWPKDITQVKTRAPVTILREQAARLSELTGGVIEGKAVARRAGGLGDEDLYVELRLVVPSLDGYEYSLLSIQHRLMLYPATVFCSAANMEREVNSENELLEVLRTVLNSPQVKSILQSLMAQCAA